MNTRILLIVVPVAILLSGCGFAGALRGNLITGSGKSVTKTYSLADFTSISIANSFQAQVTRADSYGVEITADDNLFDYIQVTKNGSTLRIQLDDRHQYSLGSNELHVKLALPALAGLELSGASSATLSGFKSTQDLSVNVSGASRLDGSIEAGAVRMEATGGSRVQLQGTGQNATLTASGASYLQLDSFSLDRASVELSGASSAVISARTNLDYNLSGAAHLSYRGSPALGSTQSSGASSVSQE